MATRVANRSTSTAITVKIHITGIREVLRAFNQMPKEASKSLRERTLELSQLLATRVRGAAVADSKQSALIAPTVRAARDRVPAIIAGGMKRVGSRRKPAYKILFGSEFGSNHLRQFRPHRGRNSYWFFKEVERNESAIGAAWLKVADDVVRSFAKGGV